MPPSPKTRKLVALLRSLAEGIIIHTAIEATIVSLLTRIIDSIFLGAIIGIAAVEIGHVVYREAKGRWRREEKAHFSIIAFWFKFIASFSELNR